MRTLFLKASPMGLMASTTWSCSLTRSTKKLNRASGVPSVCFDFSRCLWYHAFILNTCLSGSTYLSICLILLHISFFSSMGNMLGTSPVLSRLPMSSRKFSSLIWVSGNTEGMRCRTSLSVYSYSPVKRNTACESPSALFLNIFFKSSLHSTDVYPLPIST